MNVKMLFNSMNALLKLGAGALTVSTVLFTWCAVKPRPSVPAAKRHKGEADAFARGYKARFCC
jgi:hypothetical protein